MTAKDKADDALSDVSSVVDHVAAAVRDAVRAYETGRYGEASRRIISAQERAYRLDSALSAAAAALANYDNSGG
jgi:hypothetical protein